MRSMKIVVVGCGRAGAGLATELSKRGHHVTVVDHDLDALKRLGSGFKGRTLVGVGFDRDVLVEAGIEKADGLAAVTASDEANVVAAQVARHIFHVPRVVARIYDPRQAEIYRRLGLQTIAPTTWGVHSIADLLCYSQLDAVLSMGSGEVSVVQAEISPLLVGRVVNALDIAGEARVISITRNGKAFMPTLGTTFEAGDMVHICVASSATDRLNMLLASR
jgi:trk system potassium uptake protein TrkA